MCSIISALVLVVKTVPWNNAIESIYTKTMYFETMTKVCIVLSILRRCKSLMMSLIFYPHRVAYFSARVVNVLKHFTQRFTVQIGTNFRTWSKALTSSNNNEYKTEDEMFSHSSFVSETFSSPANLTQQETTRLSKVKRTENRCTEQSLGLFSQMLNSFDQGSR